MHSCDSAACLDWAGAGAAGWLMWWALASGLAILIAGTLMMISLRSASGLPRPAMLAVLAFAAVLPEYSIDAYYAWLGADPYRFEYAPLTLAATTSSMRLIVGLGWPLAILLGARGLGLGKSP